uniref:Uncharacterized protein n=1 Tax=Rhizophora mucronata TaxID=61149 RepID=A0A2P2MF71_RHIMU
MPHASKNWFTANADQSYEVHSNTHMRTRTHTQQVPSLKHIKIYKSNSIDFVKPKIMLGKRSVRGPC